MNGFRYKNTCLFLIKGGTGTKSPKFAVRKHAMKTKPMLKWFRKTTYILTLMMICGAHQAQSQPIATHADTLFSISVKEIPADVVKVLTSPFNWNKTDWFTSISICAATALAMPADQPVSNFFSANQSDFTANFSKYAIEPLGSGLYLLPALGLSFAGGVVTGDKKLQYASFKSAEAWIFAAGATQAAKQLLHRRRPYDSPDDPFIFEGPGISFTHTSFPSGHTSTAFAVATVWARVYADTPWVGVVSYTTAALVGISRMHDQQHWLSDVLAGAAIGYWMGSTLVPRQSTKSKKIALIPVAGDGYYRLAVVWRPHSFNKPTPLF